MDPNALVAAIEGVKRASSIAKALISSDATLEKAELKLQLADLMTVLADARQALAESSEVLAERQAEIGRLEQALQLQGEVERRGDAYFRIDENGQAHGDALCSLCWEQDHRLIHLTTAADAQRQRICPRCKHRVHWNRIARPNGG